MWPFRKRVAAQPVEHQRLGTLEPAEDGWSTTLSLGERTVPVHIAGRDRPEPEALAFALSILDSPEPFFAEVARFVGAEADSDRWSPPDAGVDSRDSIRAIADADIEELLLLSGTTGMIFFAVDDPHGFVWRCDLVDRKPANLGFDS